MVGHGASSEYFSSYLFNSLASSGPPTVQRFGADSLSVIPTMPPPLLKLHSVVRELDY